MAVERPSQPEAIGSAAARTEPKTVPAANAPAAPRRNVWREISRANVGLPRFRHVPDCRSHDDENRVAARLLRDSDRIETRPSEIRRWSRPFARSRGCPRCPSSRREHRDVAGIDLRGFAAVGVTVIRPDNR